jgi:cysteinyl-tRNA synthetase
MSEAHLGTHFDIHGGGVDLIFPHHENEVAQSVCAHAGEPFVNFWVHNGFLSVDSTKMSKSLGNFVTAHDVLKEWPGEVVRLALLSSHYRDPLDWTEQRLREAKQTLDRWYRVIALPGIPAEGPRPIPSVVIDALSDDLNAPLAITQLHELAGAYHNAREDAQRGALREDLLNGAKLLGLLGFDADQWFRGVETGSEGIDDRIAARTLARKQRRFADADRIRDELATKGILLEDGPGGTTWRRA